MALAAGTRIGSYEIVDAIGAGGMGEVYRATDTNLKRDVAIKVLPDSFAGDADRLARFRREAELLASLNHPNIAQVFGLETSDGRAVIVMELVDGPTLAERIAAGPLPPDEALPIARQIADALEAAHGAQVVHRDLKPANVKLRSDGTVKVLDFGIAKSIDVDSISGRQTPTLVTPAVTQTGVILGTAAYMSPEQARGRPVDQRTDIWAFGCLLFEMLTGQPAFGGEDVMLTLARVLDRDTDLTSMPKTLSPAVRHTIRLCLEKDPKRRIADIRDVRLALDGAFESELPRSAERAQAPPVWRRAAPAAAAALGAAAATFVALGGLTPAPAPEVRRQVHTLPADARLNNPAIPAIAVSPDGSEIVYAAGAALYRRRLSELEARPIPGTMGLSPVVPSYSPDGAAVVLGAMVDGQYVMSTVSVEGGTPLPVRGAEPVNGWVWSAADTIHYGAGCGIFAIPPEGGEPERLVDDTGFACFEPTALAGTERLIVERRPNGAPERAEIVVYTPATGEKTVLFPGKQPTYVEPGYLVYSDVALGLMGRAFDPRTLEYGRPVGLGIDALQVNVGGGVQFRVSPNGTLIYIRGGLPDDQGGLALNLVDLDGVVEPLEAPAREYRFLSVSPDGQRLAAQVGIDADAEIFIYDLAGDSEIRQLTFGGGNLHPAWSPDGEWITFSSGRDGTRRVYRQRADGSGVAEPLTPAEADVSHGLQAWAPDGRLAYARAGTGVDPDIWIVSVPDGAPELLVGAEGQQFGVAFSPDGNAMAYSSNTGGPLQVFVEPYPPDGSRVRVSEAGVSTIWPVWSRDGTRLSYQLATNGGVGLVDVDTQNRFALRNRRMLPQQLPPDWRLVDGVPGTDKMLMALPPGQRNAGSRAATEIVVVEHWTEELKARVPPLE